MEASRKQFTCANPEKSQRTKEILQNIYDDQASQLDFDGSKARKVPSFVVRFYCLFTWLFAVRNTTFY